MIVDIVGIRAHQRDARAGFQGENAIVFKQDDTLAGGPEGGLLMSVGMNGLKDCLCRQFGMIEQSRLELADQYPADRPVDQAFRNPPVADRRHKGRIASGPQIDVDTGFQRHLSGFLPASGHPVIGGQAVNAHQVGNHQPVEAPFIAEHAGQQGFVARRWNAVDGIVRSHHGACAGLDRLAERRQEILFQVAFADHGGVAVVAAGGNAIGHEVLERGQDALRGGAPHQGGRQFAREERIFAVGLLDPRPARLTGQVDDRAVAHRRTLRTEFRPDGLPHFLHQRRVPSRGQADACRENRRPDGHMAVGHLFVEKDRNITVDESLSQRSGPVGRQARFQGLLCPGIGPECGPEIAAVQGIHVLPPRFGEDGPVGRFLIHRPAERTEQLADFLLQGQGLQQRVGALFRRQRGVVPVGRLASGREKNGEKDGGKQEKGQRAVFHSGKIELVNLRNFFDICFSTHIRHERQTHPQL